MSTETKKRSTYKRGSKLDLPKHVDKAKYAYRWINNTNLKAADGYEHRGWEVDIDPDGKNTRRGEDLILGRMPLHTFDEMKAQKDDDRKDQLRLLFEEQAEANERDAFAFKRKGGKVKFEFKQE